MAEEKEESKADEFINAIESLVINIMMWRLSEAKLINSKSSGQVYFDRIEEAKADLKELMETE